MESLIIFVFVIGYLAIAFEHRLKIDKLIPALIMMSICWALLALGIESLPNWYDASKHALLEGFSSFSSAEKMHLMEETLLHHLGKTAEILVFLLGAMTIVEIINYFDGFSSIKILVKTNKKTKLIWIFSILGFFLSSVIDNLTATIILISILQKIVDDRNTRLYLAGLIIIAANAGGAWSPIGDVTTTMLWMGNKVSTVQLVKYLFIPSVLCIVVPALIASFLPVFRGHLDIAKRGEEQKTSKFGTTMLVIGLAAIVFVPIFKMITHLPPYIGMMLSLSLVAIFAEVFSKSKFSLTSYSSGESQAHAHHSPVLRSLSKIELPSILFFLGILMAVASLESLGILFQFASSLKSTMPMLGTELNHAGVSDLVILLLGVGSAVIDNVPLVAASLGMFSEGIDNELWHFVAFSAGTGGSMLIIGSAAGVVAMGMEKIDFFWYLKNISWLALMGFLVGSASFMVMRTLF